MVFSVNLLSYWVKTAITVITDSRTRHVKGKKQQQSEEDEEEEGESAADTEVNTTHHSATPHTLAFSLTHFLIYTFTL